MKNMLNIRICRALFAGALLTGLVTGCDNADLGALDNAAYIKEAQKASSTTVKVEDDGVRLRLPFVWAVRAIQRPLSASR